MGKYKVPVIILSVVIFLSLLVFSLIGSFRQKGAGLLVETNPSAIVYLDGVQVGKTPYETTVKPGEVTLKLVPESTETPLTFYETKVTLISGIKTVVKRDFGETDETSQGEIISFEKVGGSQTGISIVTNPDSAQISLDGQIRGFSPVKISSLLQGEHQVILSAPGYLERTVNLKSILGYKLTLIVKLAKDSNAQKTPEPEVAKETKTILVEILTTPTGYLRVRSEPSSSATEVAQVKPGEKYAFLEDDAQTGWFKIEYQKGKSGWVSNQYAKKIEGVLPSPTPVASPSAKPKPSPTGL